MLRGSIQVRRCSLRGRGRGAGETDARARAFAPRSAPRRVRPRALQRLFASSAGALKKTALHEWHVAQGAKMVDFAGYSMPVQYPAGIKAEHEAVRGAVGVFDVSHMAQVTFTGADRVAFLESLMPGDIAALEAGTGRLTMLLNERGGIVDDCVVVADETDLHVVLNAGCRDKDLALISSKLGDFSGDVQMRVEEERALLAVQGPKTEAVLGDLLGLDLSQRAFMTGQFDSVSLAGNASAKTDVVRLTRCGYTGEDGFELALPAAKVAAFADRLLAHPDVSAAGLGARDSLRLEAGLCLYGNDLDETTTPNEASLMWTISKRRRAEGGFPGHAVITSGEKPARRRIGFTIQGSGPPARADTEVLHEGNVVGRVTSGTFSPTLGYPVGMAYVAQGTPIKPGTELQLAVRKRIVPAVVTKMPFVPSNYKTL